MSEELKEAPVVQMNGTEKKKGLTNGELLNVYQMLGQARAYCRKAKGDMVFAISRNLEMAKRYMNTFDKKRMEGIEMFATKDDKGQIKLKEQTEEEIKAGKKPEAHFEEGQQEKCREYIHALMMEEAEMSKPFYTIPLSSFSAAEIDMEKFTYLDFFIEMFVVEK